MVSFPKVARGIDFAGASSHGRQNLNSAVSRTISYKESDALIRAEKKKFRRKVALFVVAIIVVFFFSLCFMGAQGQYYPYSEVGSQTHYSWTAGYAVYTPFQVLNVIWVHIYNLVANLTRLYAAYPQSWLAENCPGYWAVPYKAQVLGITMISAVLLSISGMLYQNVFKNPLAGPGMLGAGSGVSLGVLVLVWLYGVGAQGMLKERYILCYAMGAAILIFVLLVGKKVSGKGKTYDIVSMILVGSILSQFLGTIVGFVSLYLMTEEDYTVFYTISQMLVVDTSLLSWIILGIVAIISLVPIYILRFQMNAFAFSEDEAKLMGVNPLRLRSIALLCGAIMILAAQIHVGAIGLVTLVVPYLSRAVFGCEFKKQLVGNILIGILLLIFCRTLVDMIPFVGDGLSISSFISVAVLPLFITIMVKQARTWE